MNVASAIVIVFLFALAGLAVWRNIRKGAPCSCGDCSGCGRARNRCRCREYDRDEIPASNGKSDRFQREV